MDDPLPAPERTNTMRGRVTSHDVARAAGVSQSTVSRVLRNHPAITEETRQRVLAAVATLGYTPSELGRSLVTQSTRTIGMVVTDLENPFYPYLIAPLHDELSSLGYRMLLVTDAEDANVSQHLLGRSVDGVVLTTTTLDSSLPAELAAHDVPFVFLTREADDIVADAAVVDNALGASLMATEVLRHGHRRIGAVLGPENTSTGRDRERGLRVTLATHDLSLDDCLVRHGPFVTNTGYAGTVELMALPSSPSIVVCGNDSIALGAMNAARSLGLSVPADLSIVGFDDLPMAAWEIVELTTVHQPMDDMARSAARLLVDRVEGRAEPGRARRTVFEPKLIIRSTLGAPRP
jgi:LacI family transcriptional regulator